MCYSLYFLYPSCGGGHLRDLCYGWSASPLRTLTVFEVRAPAHDETGDVLANGCTPAGTFGPAAVGFLGSCAGARRAGCSRVWRVCREVYRLGGATRRLAELTRPESLRLLGGVPFGRIVYTVRALPAIVPVRHLLDDGMVVVRTHVGGDCAGAVVAFQADSIDPVAESGWSVTVTGVARRVQDPAEIARYESELAPFVDVPNVEVIRIYPELVSGYELVSAT